MPVQVDVIFGGGPLQLGILMSTIGVGALLGSLFIAGLTENVKRGVVLLVASALSAAAILVSTYVTVFLIGIVAMLALGLGDSGRRALNSALILEQTDPDHRGRVMGIYMLNFGLRPLGCDSARHPCRTNQHPDILRSGRHRPRRHRVVDLGIRSEDPTVVMNHLWIFNQQRRISRDFADFGIK